MGTRNGVVTWELVAILVLIATALVALASLLPREILVVIVAATVVAVAYFSGAVYLFRGPSWLPARLRRLPIVLAVLVPLLAGGVLLSRYWSQVTPVLLVFVLGLLFVFLYYWLVVPVALVQKLGQERWTRPDEPWPDITVLVPAYNEERYVGRCIDSITAASYPAAVDVIVIDDGSTDGTLQEARDHATDATTVVSKPNGGKHSALNAGVKLCDTDVVVSVDADSHVAPDALTELVREFDRHPDAGAIAGNVKVDNRVNLVTNLQALEYVVGINTFRRAFDLLGLVTVVPGSLGAFRRETLEAVRGYSADTLTEDFDLTVEILKRGHSIHASEGVVYTEAPDTWRDLYRQRLRWFRGNLQTLIKHAEVFGDDRFGLLHRLGFPYVFLSMSLLPLLGIAIVALIAVSVVTGGVEFLILIAGFFVLLQVLLSALAIRIEGEQMRLALLAPFSVFGYKQFLDAILLKSVVDVGRGGDLAWTSASRARQRTTGSDAPSRDRTRGN